MEAHLQPDNTRSPLVRGQHVTFRYAGRHAHQVQLAADCTDWRPVSMVRDVAGWSLTRTFPPDARVEYIFIVDGQSMLDPHNPRQAHGPFGACSECRLPAYQSPRPLAPPRYGSLTRTMLAGRAVEVYLPARIEGAALLVVQDGADYVRFAGMPGLLDALIDEGVIGPTVAVFVDPQDRDRDYTMSDQYVEWVVEQMVPAVMERYPIDPAADRPGLVGASLGGLIATYGVLRRSDVFQLCGAQSPAYRLSVARQRLDAILRDGHDIAWSSLRFHVDGGTLESILHGREFLHPIRRGAEALRARGSAVQFHQVNEGHNWTSWRSRLPQLLTWLLAP